MSAAPLLTGHGEGSLELPEPFLNYHAGEHLQRMLSPVKVAYEIPGWLLHVELSPPAKALSTGLHNYSPENFLHNFLKETNGLTQCSSDLGHNTGATICNSYVSSLSQISPPCNLGPFPPMF